MWTLCVRHMLDVFVCIAELLFVKPALALDKCERWENKQRVMRHCVVCVRKSASRCCWECYEQRDNRRGERERDACSSAVEANICSEENTQRVFTKHLQLLLQWVNPWGETQTRSGRRLWGVMVKHNVITWVRLNTRVMWSDLKLIKNKNSWYFC